VMAGFAMLAYALRFVATIEFICFGGALFVAGWMLWRR
jgi:hypothetical protein